MEIPVKEIKNIKEGVHEGKIIDVQNRTDPFEYTDYMIQLDMGINIKHGVPTNVNINEDGEPTSTHAKLLKALGLLDDGNVNPEKAIGMKISLMTINEKTKNGTFARVVDGSVKKL